MKFCFVQRGLQPKPNLADVSHVRVQATFLVICVSAIFDVATCILYTSEYIKNQIFELQRKIRRRY